MCLESKEEELTVFLLCIFFTGSRPGSHSVGMGVVVHHRSLSPSPADPEQVRRPDMPKRLYHTAGWHLQPQLNLLSWAPGEVTFVPPIDWLLEKLGFKRPKDTIPKWSQRTLMDHLDLLLATVSKEVEKRRHDRKNK